MTRKRISIEVEGREALLEKLHQLGVQVERVLQEAVLAGAEIGKELAEQRAPGALATEPVEDRRGRSVAQAAIGPDKEHWYYRFFEFGAEPHEITPKVKKALAYQGEGGPVVVGRVMHPGMAARPFLRPTVDQHADDIRDAVGAVLKRVIEEAAR